VTVTPARLSAGGPNVAHNFFSVATDRAAGANATMFPGFRAVASRKLRRTIMFEQLIETGTDELRNKPN